MSFEGEKMGVQHHEKGEAHHALLEDDGISKRMAYINLWSCGGAINYGFSAAIIASSLGQPNLYAYFASGFAHGNINNLISAIVAMYNVGGLFGCFATSFFGDRFGRKSTFWFGSFFTFLGTGLCVGSVNLTMLCFGRFFSGFGGWTTLMSSIIYAAECAPATRRGLLAGAVGPSVTIGYIIAAWLGLGFFYVDATFNWRAAFLLQIFPTLFILAGLPFVPESPRWLALKGRDAEALEVLKKIHFAEKDPSFIVAREEHYQITSQVKLDSTLPQGWLSMFTTYRRRTWTACLVTIANQSTGIQIITNYGPIIYGSLGLSASTTLIVAAVWLVSGMFWGTLCVYLHDRVGRRPLIIWSIIFCGIFIGILAVLVGIFKDSDNQTGKRACVAFFFVFLIAYEFNEPVMFLYIGEVIPTHMRNKGVALALAFINIWSIWITMTQPLGVANIGAKYYALFPIMCLIATVLQWFYIVETNGKTLEEVAGLFGDLDQVAVRTEDITIDAQGNVVDVHHAHKPTNAVA